MRNDVACPFSVSLLANLIVTFCPMKGFRLNEDLAYFAAAFLFEKVASVLSTLPLADATWTVIVSDAFDAGSLEMTRSSNDSVAVPQDGWIVTVWDRVSLRGPVAESSQPLSGEGGRRLGVSDTHSRRSRPRRGPGLEAAVADQLLTADRRRLTGDDPAEGGLARVVHVGRDRVGGLDRHRERAGHWRRAGDLAVLGIDRQARWQAGGRPAGDRRAGAGGRGQLLSHRRRQAAGLRAGRIDRDRVGVQLGAGGKLGQHAVGQRGRVGGGQVTHGRNLRAGGRSGHRGCGPRRLLGRGQIAVEYRYQLGDAALLLTDVLRERLRSCPIRLGIKYGERIVRAF